MEEKGYSPELLEMANEYKKLILEGLKVELEVAEMRLEELQEEGKVEEIDFEKQHITEIQERIEKRTKWTPEDYIEVLKSRKKFVSDTEPYETKKKALTMTEEEIEQHPESVDKSQSRTN